jgi:hypothetical protein
MTLQSTRGAVVCNSMLHDINDEQRHGSSPTRAAIEVD